MKKRQYAAALVLATVVCWGAGASLAESDYKVVTIISADTLESTKKAAPMVVRVDPEELVELK